MLRSIWLLFVYVSFLGLSCSAPFVATLGYVWVDTFQPQSVAYIVLNQFPVAMIMAVVALGGYLLLDRRSPPPFTLQTGLHVTMAVWVTLTLIWAQVPSAAWDKWDWAFKTLVFSAFIPLVIRSRLQIEAFAQTYVLSLAANFVPYGLKVLISGGGYGMDLGLGRGNTGLGEGGYLSTSCLMAVPLAIFLGSYTQLMPKFKLLPLAYWGIAALAIVTALGTYERSALIGLVVLGIYMWVRSKHKIFFGIIVTIVACLVIYSTSSGWNARVSTIGDFQQEDSAYSRILIWQWTLGFVAEHPLGGGFSSYIINHIEIPARGGNPGFTQFGRAFHSSYFEVLGEHGYPGLAIFLVLAGSTLLMLRRVAKKARPYPELKWVVGLSDALQSGLVVFLSSGAFVGLAFQPMFWNFISMSVCLNAYMWRVEHAAATVPTGWRAMAMDPGQKYPPIAAPAGWRKRADAASFTSTALPVDLSRTR